MNKTKKFRKLVNDSKHKKLLIKYLKGMAELALERPADCGVDTSRSIERVSATWHMM